MMRNAFKLILFSIVLNFAVGIMQVAVVDANGNQVFQAQDMARVPQYDSTNNGLFQGYAQSNYNPGATSSDSGNVVFRLLDLISLGFIRNIVELIDQFMFGFINFLNAMFGRWLNPALYALLFGANLYVSPSSYVPVAGLLKIIILVGYAFGIFELWTNKTLTD